MWSPGIVIFVLSLGLGHGLLAAALRGLFAPVLGLLVYGLVYAGLSYVVAPASDWGEAGSKAADAAFKPVGAAGLVVAALVWGWWSYDARSTERYVVSCVKDFAIQADAETTYRYEFESSVEDIVRWCFEQADQERDGYHHEW